MPKKPFKHLKTKLGSLYLHFTDYPTNRDN